MYVKKEKCFFAKQEVEFLGHRIKDGKLMMDPAKVQAIQDWLPPSKVPEMRLFLSLVNYYRCFIKGYSAILRKIRPGVGVKNAKLPLML